MTKIAYDIWQILIFHGGIVVCPNPRAPRLVAGEWTKIQRATTCQSLTAATGLGEVWIARLQGRRFTACSKHGSNMRALTIHSLVPGLSLHLLIFLQGY